MWLACLPWRPWYVVGLPALEEAMLCGWLACPGGGYGMVCGRLAYPGGGGKLACLKLSYIYSLKKGDISLYLYIYIYI